MKPCHDTLVLQFKLEGPRPSANLCFNVHVTVARAFPLVSCTYFQILLWSVDGQKC